MAPGGYLFVVERIRKQPDWESKYKETLRIRKNNSLVINISPFERTVEVRATISSCFNILTKNQYFSLPLVVIPGDPGL